MALSYREVCPVSSESAQTQQELHKHSQANTGTIVPDDHAMERAFPMLVRDLHGSNPFPVRRGSVRGDSVAAVACPQRAFHEGVLFLHPSAH